MAGWMALAMLMFASAPATVQEGPAPAARVQANAVVHPGEALTVRVPQSATYAGGERFTLYGVADCEVHVFIEADANRRMRRLWWIQFESYLPSQPELSYDYAEGNTRMMIGGTATWVRAGPVRTDGPMREGSDREAVFRILKRGGYPIPAEVMNVRMVQMLDDPQGTGKGRRELMIIYSENLAQAGKTVAELTTEGKPNERWTVMGEKLIEWAIESVKVDKR